MQKELFTQAAERYLDDIFRVAYSICRNRSDSEDIVQNVFEKLFVSDTVFENDEHLKKWLIAVTVNEARSLLRTVWKRRVDYYLPEIGKTHASRSSNEALSEALAGLKDKYRILIHLYYYEDMSIKEIAELLKMSESAVKTGLHRARQLLKKKLHADNIITQSEEQ